VLVDDDENGGGALALTFVLKIRKHAEQEVATKRGCSDWQPLITVLDIMTPVYDSFHTAREFGRRLANGLPTELLRQVTGGNTPCGR
jgi:hypothetical protein